MMKKKHNGLALGNLIGIRATTNKKLIWLKVILLLHSFSAKANLPVLVDFFFVFLLPLQLAVARWPFNENFYFFQNAFAFRLGAEHVHLILFILCTLWSIFLCLNQFESEMKMCAYAGHSLKKRVEFKHRFWRLNGGFFGCRMKVKGGRSRRNDRLKIQNYNSKPNEKSEHWQWNRKCTKQKLDYNIWLSSPRWRWANDVSDAIAMICQLALFECRFYFWAFAFVTDLRT